MVYVQVDFVAVRIRNRNGNLVGRDLAQIDEIELIDSDISKWFDGQKTRVLSFQVYFAVLEIDGLHVGGQTEQTDDPGKSYEFGRENLLFLFGRQHATFPVALGVHLEPNVDEVMLHQNQYLRLDATLAWIRVGRQCVQLHNAITVCGF